MIWGVLCFEIFGGLLGRLASFRQPKNLSESFEFRPGSAGRRTPPHFHYRFQLPDPLRFDSEGFPKFGVPPTGHGALIELPRTRLVRNTVQFR